MALYIAEGQVLLLKEGGYSIEEDIMCCRSFVEEQERVHFIGLSVRPGVHLWMATIEYTYYIPQSPRADFLYVRAICWQSLIWYLISVPADDHAYMESIAAQCALRVKKGIPAISRDTGIAEFPIAAQQMYSLLPVKQHPVYRNDPHINAMLRQEEQEAIIAIITGQRPSEH